MKLILSSFLLFTTLLTAHAALAAGPVSARFACHGNSSVQTISLIQYQADNRLESLVLFRDGDSIAGKIMGANDFPMSSAVGDRLYGAPPTAEWRIELTREIDPADRFGVRFSEKRNIAPVELECRIL